MLTLISTHVYILFSFSNSLGSPHDGSGDTLRCAISDNYIMAPTAGFFATNLNNTFRFSVCSIQKFKNLLIGPTG